MRVPRFNAAPHRLFMPSMGPLLNTSPTRLNSRILIFVQTLDDILSFGLSEQRLRGGVDAADIVQAALGQGIQADPSISLDSLTQELLDRMQVQEEALSTDAPKSPRHGTIRWYQDHLDDKVAAGSDVTVLQACYCLAWLKLKGGMTVQSMNYFCRMLSSGGFLPAANNIMPRYERVSTAVYM